MKIVFGALILLSTLSSYSQFLLKGKLIDASTSKPIENANIIIYGTTTGTHSTPDGTFELEIIEKKVSLVISHLTYSTLQTELTAKGKEVVLELNAAVNQLDLINIRLGEYDRPKELVEFDPEKYEKIQQSRLDDSTKDEYKIVENPAEFYGGKNNLKPFVARNFRYPKQVMEGNLEGRAYAIFTITKEGFVDSVEIKIMGEDPEDVLRHELERLIKSMPKWHPAYQRGRPVPVRFVLPITYAANGYGNKN